MVCFECVRLDDELENKMEGRGVCVEEKGNTVGVCRQCVAPSSFFSR